MAIRIALVTHELTGGVGTMTRFLHRVLVESGKYEPEVILLATSMSDPASVLLRRPGTWRSGPRCVRESDRGLDYVRVGAWLSEFEYQRYRPRSSLTSLLNRYELLQFVAGTAPWVEVAKEVAKPKCVWVATTNSGDRASRANDGGIPRRVWSALMRAGAEVYENRGLAAADSIFALSPYTQRSLASKLGSRHAILAYCGVDTELFRPAGVQSRKEGDHGYILCVGRLSDSRKNIAMLLRAYAALASSLPEIPDLCLVGEPPGESLELLIAELGIGNRLRITGPKQSEELARLYREALFFVLSSDEEGLGIVILEAMASGLAVVSTASGGPSSIIAEGESGFLTPVGNEQAFSKAMRVLIESASTRERFGGHGRAIVETSFSIAAAGRVFLDEHERLISTRKNQPS